MNPQAFYKLSYGLYIISSKRDTKFNGQIANTVFQITAEPPTIAVSINKQNLTHEFIKESKVFSVSILSIEAPMKLIGQFGFKSGREIDKFRGVNYKVGENGVPIVLDNTIGYIEAKVVKEIDAGTHTLFLGEVTEAQILQEKEPMTYAYYHLIKKGLTPKASPLYTKKEKSVGKMQRYVCTVCGYVYDPEFGDPDSNVKPGTPFEELPDDWVCPVCGAPKSKFEVES